MKNIGRLSILAISTLLILPLVGNSSAFSLKEKISQGTKSTSGATRNHYNWQKPLRQAPDNAGVFVGKPDLKIVSVSRNICLEGGSVTIKNVGTETSKATYTQVNATKFRGFYTRPLKPNETTMLNALPHPNPTFQEITVHIFVDSALKNNESNESNNTKDIACIY